MKLSDYVAAFLARRGVRHVFAVSGGASLHLIHSVADTPGIEFVCPQHEQAGAMAADGYARVSENWGAAIATSGPGATNMITGVCSAYYDSIPVLYLTGQVATFRLRGDTGVRQVGFQETEAVAMYTPITKYAVRLDDPTRIRFELEKAHYLSTSGRPGPVMLDIPDDIQRAQVEPEALEPFTPPADSTKSMACSEEIARCLDLLLKARRPVLILGAGVHLAKAVKEARRLIEALRIPVAPTWAAADILPATDPLNIGTFGTHGTRFANFAVQNADLILSVGSRLDTKATGSPANSFAREARKIVVDIDAAELNKFGRFGLEIDVLVQADAKEFLQALNREIVKVSPPSFSEWEGRIAAWKSRYPVCLPAYHAEAHLNPYVFVKHLADACREGETIFLDTGCTLAWMMQAFECKHGQRVYHDWNNTAMGWALPASIGACFALDQRPVVCVTGDGSLQMNIQELATVIRHQLPIKVFLLNNHGYSMIQQTQDQWLGSQYHASCVDGGLAFPDFERVARAYGYETFRIARNAEARGRIGEVLQTDGPVFCNVEVRPEHRVVPQVKFGRPNEDLEPLLPREEFLENMIVKPLDVSLK